MSSDEQFENARQNWPVAVWEIGCRLHVGWVIVSPETNKMGSTVLKGQNNFIDIKGGMSAPVVLVTGASRGVHS